MHLLTHIPKNPHCIGCLRAKLNAKQARRRHPQTTAQAFGDIVTADHLIARDADGAGIDNEKVAIVFKDHHTRWIDIFPTAGKSAHDAEKAIGCFQGTRKKESIKLMYTDNAPELVTAIDKLGLQHDTSTPYRSTTNSIAERNIRTVLEGTRTLLEHSGFPVPWWPYAAKCFCFSMNIVLSDGDSNYNKRFGNGHFTAKTAPFGCLVDFLPPTIVQQKTPKFAKKSLPGLFLGYAQHVGGRWAGDYLVTPLDDFQPTNTSRTVRVFRIKEIIIDETHGFLFPLRTVAEKLTRTIGPHGESTEFHVPGLGGANPYNLVNKVSVKVKAVKTKGPPAVTDDLIPDPGSGKRPRLKNTLRPRTIDTHDWRKLSIKTKSEILEHIVEKAGIDLNAWRKQTRKQQIKTLDDIARKEGHMDAAVASCVLRSKTSKVPEEEIDHMLLNPSPEIRLKAEHLLISPEPAPIKKTDFVKRHIVEFCCGENS